MKLETKAKPFTITKSEVMSAWERVKANRGAGGVDKQSLSDFESDLSKNLYKLWNRMSSGSYFPQAVRRVEIPKKDGSIRGLGIPTIRDRVAQEVVRARLEKEVEPIFHEDSYGYRAAKSALDAIKTTRQRNFEFDWVLDVDIRQFFDNINHELLMKAVRKHSQDKWVELYVERFLKAPTLHKDGRMEENDTGTPQGGVISPLLANLYLHYAFDMWLPRNYPQLKFERYADDMVIHCQTEEQCEAVRMDLSKRLEECGLQLHPQKTQKVYCKDYARHNSYSRVSYTFLGYTFKPRDAKGKHGKFTAFSPSASSAAKKELRRKLRERKMFTQTHMTVEEIAKESNAVVQGWIQYFCHYRRDGLRSIAFHIEGLLIRWVQRKFRLAKRQAIKKIERLRNAQPNFFAHWAI